MDLNRVAQLAQLDLLLSANFDIDNSNNRIKSLIYKLLKHFSKLINVNYWNMKFRSNQLKYKQLNTKYVVNLCVAYYYSKALKERTMFQQFDKLKFEGYDLSVPKEYDKYLTDIYGNYMNLPPAKERNSRHKIEHIDLGNYEIKNKIIS